MECGLGEGRTKGRIWSASRARPGELGVCKLGMIKPWQRFLLTFRSSRTGGAADILEGVVNLCAASRAMQLRHEGCISWGRGRQRLVETGVALAGSFVVDGEEVVARQHVEAERARGSAAGGDGVLRRGRTHVLVDVELLQVLVERRGRQRRSSQRVVARRC